MILYFYYNADLLDITSKNQITVTFVDDVNIYAKGNMFKEAYDSL